MSKSGGSALRTRSARAREENGGTLECEIRPDLGDTTTASASITCRGARKAVFALRDPLTRFISGFYSGLRKGAPRYDIGWSKGEKRAFSWFSTPQELADALASPDPTLRGQAEFAMRLIRHVSKPRMRWNRSPACSAKHIDKILYVAHQETLDEDWERLKELLRHAVARAPPRDEVTAHKTAYPANGTLSEDGKEPYASGTPRTTTNEPTRGPRRGPSQRRIPAQPSIQDELKLAFTT